MWNREAAGVLGFALNECWLQSAVSNRAGVENKEDLKASECPILLITAEEELGAILFQDTAEWITKTYKNVKELNIKGVGHSIHREKYKEVMAGLLEFLLKQFV